MKLISNFFTAVGVIAAAFFAIDSISWIVSGNGIIEQLGGDRSPLLSAIAYHLAGLPLWAFFLVCAAAVGALSVVIAILLVRRKVIF
jgi:hypothetical protein